MAPYLSSYTAATPGVQPIEDVYTVVSGRRFTFSCRVLTEQGSGNVDYRVSF